MAISHVMNPMNIRRGFYLRGSELILVQVLPTSPYVALLSAGSKMLGGALLYIVKELNHPGGPL
jgi:hypothetical protein